MGAAPSLFRIAMAVSAAKWHKCTGLSMGVAPSAGGPKFLFGEMPGRSVLWASPLERGRPTGLFFFS